MKQKSMSSEKKMVPMGSTACGSMVQLSRSVQLAATRTLRLSGQDVTLAAGLYLVLGGAGVGKSVVVAAIRAAAVAQQWNHVGGIYVFEPGAPQYSGTNTDGVNGAMFIDPSIFFAPGGGTCDLVSYLQPLTSKKQAELSLVTLDSLTDPIKGFNAKGRIGQPAGEGGMQASDRTMVSELNNWAIDNNIVFLGIINTKLLAFAPALEGATQGVIIVTDASTFLKRDRAGGRQGQSVSIDAEYLKAGLTAMGYDATAPFSEM